MKMTRKSAGFTLVEVMIVVAIIGLLASIAIPNFLHSRETAHRKVCIGNLKHLDGAVQAWALEQRKYGGDSVVSADLFGSDKFIKTVPQCPATTAPYIYGLVGDVHVRCTLAAAPNLHTLE
jgi:prepilin-type N-terminal cleavage/methylation domain-containing protein